MCSSIDHLFLNFSIIQELAVLQYLASSLITVSPPIPRMFFQKLQQTVVKVGREFYENTSSN